MKMVKKSFNITEAQQNKLREIKESTGLSETVIIRLALEEYLKKGGMV